MSLRTAFKSMAWTLGALGLAGSAIGQSAPTQHSQVFTPYWDRTTENYTDAEQAASRLIAESPQAHAFATAAKFTYLVAERELNIAVLNLKSDVESSDEYQNALNDYRAATLRYEQAKRVALRGLRENPEFAARSQMIDQLREQIQDHHASKTPDFNRVLTVASMKLEQARDLTDAETIELAGNADVQMAKEDMIASYDNLVSQRKQLERIVRNDSGLIELRAARNQAMIAHVTAATYAHRLEHARDRALRFAWFTKVQDRYTPYYGLDYGYYGHGSYYGSYGGASIRSTYYPVGVPTIHMK